MKSIHNFYTRLNTKTCLRYLVCLFCPLVLDVQAKVQFNRDIRPILSDNCFLCHGPDKADRKADLRLDTAAGIVKDLGGYQAVVPGNPEESEMYRRIIHSDPEETMPPPEAHKQLSEQHKELLAQWIKEGAQWEEHWSFEAIKKPALPTVKNPAWMSNPIDAFIAKKLDDELLTPSTQASRRTLIRRVSFDLTGLAPTPVAVAAFVADTSPDAYENLVERLLASPAYGEHRAHYWLDAARYADTHGFHLDNLRSVWPYRDWVVNAFNNNMPFDQFTVEQLAGDLLLNSTLQQKVATGFNRANSTTNEGGAIEDEYLAIYAKDRAETTAAVWLGLTVGCAACHDHKYDPVTQKEFYQFTAFFRNTTQPALDNNAFDSPPFISVPNKADLALRTSIDKKINKLKESWGKSKKSARNAFEKWQTEGGQIEKSIPVANDFVEYAVSLTQTDVKKQKLLIEGNHHWVQGKQGKALGLSSDTVIELGDYANFNLRESFSISFWIRVLKDVPEIKSIVNRFDPKSHSLGWQVSLLKEGGLWLMIKPGEKPKFYIELLNVLKRDSWHHVVFQYDGGASSNSLSVIIDGDVKPIKKQESVDLLALGTIARTKSPLIIGGKSAANTFEKNTPYIALQDLRIYRSLLSVEDIQALSQVNELQKIRQSATNTHTKEQQTMLFNYYRSQLFTSGKTTQGQLKTLQEKRQKINARSAKTLVMQERKDTEPQAYILNRGAYDNLGELVKANVPAMLPPLPKQTPKNRLMLAQWLVDRKNPLTARVTVNRFWQSVFGTGLVKTAGDFGSQGEPPSHRQLLDWLAFEFMSSGWDIKKFFKMMVMSSTYQQSSVMSPDLLAKDAENRLLARGPRFRLDAEVIRDQALAVSGLLVDKIGGPPVKPYQPEGIWKAVAYVGSNTMEFTADKGENVYRKSLYTFRKRTSAPPSMSIFDAPDRESCVVKRDVTNTPLQALLLMNDPQFVEAARNIAQVLLTTNETNKFHALVNITLGREPDGEMLAVLQETYKKVQAMYKRNPDAAKRLIFIGDSGVDKKIDVIELASWTVIANQVLNLDEFITKN